MISYRFYTEQLPQAPATPVLEESSVWALRLLAVAAAMVTSTPRARPIAFASEELPTAAAPTMVEDSSWRLKARTVADVPTIVWWVDDAATGLPVAERDAWTAPVIQATRRVAPRPWTLSSDALPTPPAAFGLEEESWIKIRSRPLWRLMRGVMGEREVLAVAPPSIVAEDPWRPRTRRPAPVSRRAFLLGWMDGVLSGGVAPSPTLWITTAKGGPRYQLEADGASRYRLTAAGGARYHVTRKGLMDTLISLADDHLIEYDIKEKNPQTRIIQAATGLTGVNAWIALSEGGAAISGTSIALTEAASKPGTYFGTIDRAAVNTALASLVGQFVYEVVDDGDDFRRVRALRVVAMRTA